MEGYKSNIISIVSNYPIIQLSNYPINSESIPKFRNDIKYSNPSLVREII